MVDIEAVGGEGEPRVFSIPRLGIQGTIYPPFHPVVVEFGHFSPSTERRVPFNHPRLGLTEVVLVESSEAGEVSIEP